MIDQPFGHTQQAQAFTRGVDQPSITALQYRDELKLGSRPLGYQQVSQRSSCRQYISGGTAIYPLDKAGRARLQSSDFALVVGQ